MTSDRKEEIIHTLSTCHNIGPKAPEHYENLQHLRQNYDQNKEKHTLVEIFNALGNPDRFFILDLLANKDRCVCELEAALNKSQPSISRHLRILEDLNLIQGWKQGKFTHYSLIKPRFHEFLSNLNKWHQEITNWFGDLY